MYYYRKFNRESNNGYKWESEIKVFEKMKKNEWLTMDDKHPMPNK